MSRALSRQRLSGLHVPFEGRDHAIERVGAGVLLGFALGQRFRNSRKAHKPPAVLLTLQFVSISESHQTSSKSCLASPSWWSIALRRPGPISFFRSFKVVNLLP